MTSSVSTSPYKTKDLRIMTEIVSGLNGIFFRFIHFGRLIHESTSEVRRHQPSEAARHQPSEAARQPPSQVAGHQPSGVEGHQPFDVTGHQPSDVTGNLSSEVTGHQPSEVTRHQEESIPMSTVKSNAHSVCIVGEWKQIYLGVI